MQDWMIVLLIGAVVIFGAAKLPQIARNMGKAQGEFKKGLREGAVEEDAAPPTTTRPATAEPPAAEGDQPRA